MDKNTALFGENLRRIIKEERNITFGKAAADIGVSLTFLNQLMNGEKNPSAETLKDICSALNTSRAALYGEKEAEKDPLPAWAEQISNRLEALESSKRDELEIIRLRKQNAELNRRTSLLPDSFWTFWEGLKSPERDVFLKLLLGEAYHPRIQLSKALLVQLRKFRENLPFE